MPPILFSFISRTASPIVASGLKVIGSNISPFSLRFTLRTWSACFSILMFLCKIPRPPSLARAMARAASVTVSMAALSIGTFNVIVLVSWVLITTSLGKTSEYAGCKSTSSNVKPSPKNLPALELLVGVFLIAIGKNRKMLCNAGLGEKILNSLQEVIKFGGIVYQPKF